MSRALRRRSFRLRKEQTLEQLREEVRETKRAWNQIGSDNDTVTKSIPGKVWESSTKIDKTRLP